MPYSNMALDADRKNGPAARSFAADAYDCIMVRTRVDLTEYKFAASKDAPMASSPRILNRQHTSDAESYAKSPCRGSSSLRVLRRQGAAKHKRR